MHHVPQQTRETRPNLWQLNRHLPLLWIIPRIACSTNSSSLVLAGARQSSLLWVKPHVAHTMKADICLSLTLCYCHCELDNRRHVALHPSITNTTESDHHWNRLPLTVNTTLSLYFSWSARLLSSTVCGPHTDAGQTPDVRWWAHKHHIWWISQEIPFRLAPGHSNDQACWIYTSRLEWEGVGPLDLEFIFIQSILAYQLGHMSSSTAFWAWARLGPLDLVHIFYEQSIFISHCHIPAWARILCSSLLLTGLVTLSWRTCGEHGVLFSLLWKTCGGHGVLASSKSNW